jgi:hypothetical protein
MNLNAVVVVGSGYDRLDLAEASEVDCIPVCACQGDRDKQ